MVLLPLWAQNCIEMQESITNSGNIRQLFIVERARDIRSISEYYLSQSCLFLWARGCSFELELSVPLRDIELDFSLTKTNCFREPEQNVGVSAKALCKNARCSRRNVRCLGLGKEVHDQIFPDISVLSPIEAVTSWALQFLSELQVSLIMDLPFLSFLLLPGLKSLPTEAVHKTWGIQTCKKPKSKLWELLFFQSCVCLALTSYLHCDPCLPSTARQRPL